MAIGWEQWELPEGRRVVRDERHGYLKVVPRPSEDELRAYYASAYRNPCVPHDPDGRAELLSQCAPTLGRVLDIGCGAGEFLDVLKARGWETVGIEPGQAYAHQARQRGLEVVQERLTPALVPRLGSFDAVLLIHVLEHLPEPDAMVRMAWDLLRPGGVLLCEVPNDFNPLQEVAVAVQSLRPWWVALPDHLNYFSIDSLAAFITAHGFDVLLKTTDFPMELFVLWGDVYVDNPGVGKATHAKRCRFEQAMIQAGHQRLLREWYAKTAELGIGREAIVCARRPS